MALTSWLSHRVSASTKNCRKSLILMYIIHMSLDFGGDTGLAKSYWAPSPSGDYSHFETLSLKCRKTLSPLRSPRVHGSGGSVRRAD